jgi:C4-dicarboxylate-specific signal transduction histidine kinase
MSCHKDKEVAFFGKITAGITHEINNVLAIIKEASGLLEDILSLTRGDTFPHKNKFEITLNRIFGQIQRGVAMTNNLNRFAHSPDHSPSSMDLNEVAEQMVLLVSRFARLKNVNLETGLKDGPLIIKTHPVSLQMALFITIEIFLDLTKSAGRITLSPRKIQNKYVVGIHFESKTPGDADLSQAIISSDRWESLQEIMAYLGGTAQADKFAPEILLYFTEAINK